MSNKPQVIFMPHANIQYSQLDPKRRAWVCENCYRPLFELVRDGDYKVAFEASGRTLEVMDQEAPAVLALLRELVTARPSDTRASGSPCSRNGRPCGDRWEQPTDSSDTSGIPACP